MFFLFHTKTNDEGVPVCENIFRDLSLSYRQAYMTLIAIVVFFIPLVILVVCYTRIFIKIARKANEGSRNRRTSIKSGKIHLQSTPSSSLPRAKIKTLKMTFVIICVFIVCSLPYFIAEMIMSYGDFCLISNELVSVLAGLAPSNSATNPFVFLLFNANIKWIKDLKQCGSNKRSPQRGYVYSSTSTANTHYYVQGNGAHVYQPSARVNHERLQMYSMNKSSLLDQSMLA
ncbi:hypothetical protein CHS0354_014303 [Potamilus streckersoni]|uniref:G-protein coupled receptors family 1 profile domain-containing protein n=1 Tax=Potamilus streckersoni TaxID=2493646 RepID=A0AAE0SKP2_9BIVA|nr:hypothetical protein CHS0354_014303 [Potamilus streckersoni]